MATVFTNNTALSYTIAAITQSGTGTVLDSLEYNNNVIEACSISSIDLDLQGPTVRSSNQFGFTNWGAVTTAYIICNVTGAQGGVVLNMTSTYDYVLDSTPLSRGSTFLGTAFIQRNKTSSPHLWWGESLMSLQWNSVAGTMESIQSAGTQSGDIILKGINSFTKTSGTDDLRDLDYFSIDYRYTIDMEDRTIGLIWPGAGGYSNNLSVLNANASRPNIWIELDNFVKSMYSTVLTDLGQTNASPNILTDQDLLRYFLSNATDTLNMNVAYNSVPGPATADDYINGTSVDILTSTFTPSVISASYLCQIPRRKSTGNLLVSIAVADLVFLNALWLIFKFIVDHFLLKDDDHTYFRVNQSSSLSSTDPANLDRAILLGQSRNPTTNTTRLSSYMPYKTATATSASRSVSSTTPTASDLFESDTGYALTTLNDVDVDDRSGKRQRTFRRPFQRRTSSSYDVLIKDPNVERRQIL